MSLRSSSVSAIFTTPFVSMFFTTTSLVDQKGFEPPTDTVQECCSPIELLTRYCRASTALLNNDVVSRPRTRNILVGSQALCHLSYYHF